MGIDEDWDELGDNKRQRKRRRQHRQKGPKMNSEKTKDDSFARFEEDRFLSNLEAKSGAFNWMKEDRYKRMFRDIESKIQGAMGEGTYDWVDRRVFDQVFDRLTLMSLYKLMKAGTIDTLDLSLIHI